MFTVAKNLPSTGYNATDRIDVVSNCSVFSSNSQAKVNVYSVCHLIYRHTPCSLDVKIIWSEKSMKYKSTRLEWLGQLKDNRPLSWTERQMIH